MPQRNCVQEQKKEIKFPYSLDKTGIEIILLLRSHTKKKNVMKLKNSCK